MRDIPIVLLGRGGVGRAFVDVVAEAAPGLARRFAIAPRVVAVRRAHLEARYPWSGADRSGPVSELPRDPSVGGREPEWRPARALRDLLADARPWVVVQAMPGDAPGETDALDAALAVLESGAHLVTATKSHLVTRWTELDEAARSSGRSIRVSGATGAALPAGDLARRGTRALGCVAIRGSLNGTSNHVLNELALGRPLGAVLADAVAAGIAEPDPAGDLGGHDAASKLVILANLAWGRGATVHDVMDRADHSRVGRPGA